MAFWLAYAGFLTAALLFSLYLRILVHRRHPSELRKSDTVRHILSVILLPGVYGYALSVPLGPHWLWVVLAAVAVTNYLTGLFGATMRSRIKEKGLMGSVIGLAIGIAVTGPGLLAIILYACAAPQIWG